MESGWFQLLFQVAILKSQVIIWAVAACTEL